MLTRFTKPDRSNYAPNLRKTPSNDQIDIGWNEGVFSDGRVYRVEAWAQDGITALSIFLPTAEIENFGNRQFIELFQREGLVSWLPGVTPSAYALPRIDDSGNSIWQVSVTIGIEDEAVAEDSFRLLPYLRATASPAGDANGVEEAEQDEEDEEPDDELADIAMAPDNLLALGYEREEEETAWVRRVWFSKSLESSGSQLRLLIRIEFELGISDEPHLSYEQARSYSFNCVQLSVIDRQMTRIDNREFDTETEHPQLIGTVDLAVHRLSDVETVVRLLAFREPWW